MFVTCIIIKPDARGEIEIHFARGVIFEQWSAEQGVSDHPLEVCCCRSLLIIGVGDAEWSHGMWVACKIGLHGGVVEGRNNTVVKVEGFFEDGLLFLSPVR